MNKKFQELNSEYLHSTTFLKRWNPVLIGWGNFWQDFEKLFRKMGAAVRGGLVFSPAYGIMEGNGGFQSPFFAFEKERRFFMTIFKKIIDREIPADIVFEDEVCLAFRDIAPQAPTHILVIPKKEISAVDALSDEDEALVGHIFLVIQKLAKQEGLTDGFRVVTNNGLMAGQTVPHLHFHLLGGRPFGWPPG